GKTQRVVDERIDNRGIAAQPLERSPRRFEGRVEEVLSWRRRARDAHPVCAGKPKLGGWRHRLGLVHAAAAWTASVPLVATRFTATASSRYSESVPAWVASSPTASTCAAIDRSNARSEPSPVIAGVAPPCWTRSASPPRIA